MKRALFEYLRGLAFVFLAASAAAGETSAPRSAEHISWAAEDDAAKNKQDSSPASDRAVVSPSAIVSTRGSFVAQWTPLSGATSYLLDVSLSPSFGSYVTGYHGLEAGPATWRLVTGLSPGTTYYYRVTGMSGTEPSANSPVMTGATVTGSGLVISPSFDSSITNNQNVAAIEAMINRAIAIYESLFSDPITVSILFRYSATKPNGKALM